ncbi:hypothetical protein [Streptomyces sp. NPDC101234]|uniref:hypothetical protein n=1 Tax=Streptomyces sp. NPDC101234 TaxID=3366138 RepID=UPI003807C1DF
MAARVGAAIGREARALGVHVVLGPGLNIKRSPLCGRNFESRCNRPQPSPWLRGDRIRLLADGTLLAELDGRYWTAETSASFTGRGIGVHAREGTVRFGDYRYTGWDGESTTA